MVCLFRRYISFLRNMDGGGESVCQSLCLSACQTAAVHLYVHPSHYPPLSIRPSCLPFRRFINLSVHPSVRPSVHFVRQCNYPSARRFTPPSCLFVRPSHRSDGPYNLSVCPSVCLSICLSVCLSICLLSVPKENLLKGKILLKFIYSSVLLSIRPSVHPACPSHLSVSPSV
jgi:hypothetical protein